MLPNFIRVVAVGGTALVKEECPKHVGDCHCRLETRFTRLSPHNDYLFFDDEERYIKVDSIESIQCFTSFRYFFDNVYNVLASEFETIDDDTVKRVKSHSEFYSLLFSQFGLTCLCKCVENKTHCKCKPLREAFLPFYQITVKNKIELMMRYDSNGDYRAVIPKYLTWLVHPDEREKMAILKSFRNPLDQLAHCATYNPECGTAVAKAKAEFNKRARGEDE